ncbi:MAG: TolC family protein [Verrucomicrobiota bacterium]
MKASKSFLLGVSLVGSACVGSLQDIRMGKAQELTPERWFATTEGRAGVDHQWVERFGDKRLEALIGEALENNYDLKLAGLRVQQAEFTAKRAMSDLSPILNGGLDSSRRRQNFIGFPEFGGAGTQAPGEVLVNRNNSFGASLDLSWELDIWGRVRAGALGDTADAQAEGQELRAARSSLVAQVSKAWFALIEANQQVENAERSLQLTKETEQIIRDRFEMGQVDDQGTGTELRLAMSDSETQRARLNQLQRVKEDSLRQLEILLGRYPQGALGAGNRLPSAPAMPPAGLPSGLLLRRPDILAAERRYVGTKFRLTEAKRAFFPQFSLTGSAGTSTEDLDEILNSDFGIWSLAGNLTQPLFVGGRLTTEKRLRELADETAAVELQQTVLEAFREVETALAVERFLARQEEALYSALQLAEEASVESRRDYVEGVGDILTLLNAQGLVLSASSDWITVRRERLENRIDLHLALGGDYQAKKL